MTTITPTLWVYLTDLAPKARIIHPATGEIREIMQAAVQDRAPIGLRRYCLEELGGGVYRETGELFPLTPGLVEDMTDLYVNPNSWNYDYPDYAFESQSDPAELERVKARLEREMADYPYEFKITGLQRRFLLYYSDGDMHSQKAFEALLPTPEYSPLRSDGTLRRPFALSYNHMMRDAKVPQPKEEYRLFGGLRPCLYRGPAYVVRFLLDGQDVLLERCRVYVDAEGNFLCSDWCQRHDYSSYNNGINLQMGLYTFATWVTGPCLVRNTQNGSFTPKNAIFERTAVRDIMKQHVLVPKFDDALAKATKKIQAITAAKPAVKPTVEAGPITEDIMAEALAAAEKLFAAKASVEPAPEPAVVRPTVDGLHRVPSAGLDEDAAGYVISYKVDGESAGRPVIHAFQHYRGDDYMTVGTTEPPRDEFFILDEGANENGAWYGPVHPDEAGEHGMEASDIEKLNATWWLYSAMVYYRENLNPSPVEATLLEA